MKHLQKFDLRKVRFGFASAEAESAQEPELLLGGFYDVEGLTNQALKSKKYLFLGYKGAGKSALGQRLKLLAETNSHLFVRDTFLGEFPFSQFTRVLKASEPTDQEAHYSAAWTWILLLYFVDSFSNDAGAVRSDALDKAVQSLRDQGLLPTGDLKMMVLKSAKKGIKGILPKFGEASREIQFEVRDNEALVNVERLKDICVNIRTESRHLLVIDGLDDILTQKSVQYHVLAALVLAVARLNLSFAQAANSAKIILLCRTDLFARLPIPNKNKIRQDFAVDLDWYHDTRDPGESGLVRLANIRAQLVYPKIEDLFETGFMGMIAGKDIRSFLTSHTRHTPRDFLQLLVKIQKYAEIGKVPNQTVIKGLREYSIKYLLPEIHDELVGYISPTNADKLFALFGAMRRTEFTLGEIQAAAARDEFYADLDLRKAIDLLFDCSAIGNCREGHYWFKYRNRDSTVNHGEKLVFHPGLWRAFGIEEMW